MISIPQMKKGFLEDINISVRIVAKQARAQKTIIQAGQQLLEVTQYALQTIGVQHVVGIWMISF